MASNPATKLTAEEYLALDRTAEFKSEFINGEMFAMSGASMRHTDLQGNIYSELHFALENTECWAHGSDFRVRVSKANYTYPDISVTCGKRLLADKEQDTLLNPTVIIEILSPSTEKYDRGLKFQLYRTIESLREYVLVDQEQVRIEHYTRQADEGWTLRDYQTLDEHLNMPSLGVSISLQRIYNRIEFQSV